VSKPDIIDFSSTGEDSTQREYRSQLHRIEKASGKSSTSTTRDSCGGTIIGDPAVTKTKIISPVKITQAKVVAIKGFHIDLYIAKSQNLS
jgi:hypothetical protein